MGGGGGGVNLGKKAKGGGGFGRAKNIETPFFGLFTNLYFLKVLEERTVFKSLLHFQKPSKQNFTQFFRISQNVAIYF